MNKKLASGLLGIGALLMASQANAATVQIFPANLAVGVSSAFQLNVQGVEFAPTNGGSFTLTWNPSVLALGSSALEISTELFNNGLGGNSISITQGQLDIVHAVSPLVPLSGTFDIAHILFIAETPPSVTDINFSTIQPGWVDENNVGLVPALQPNYVGATITVTTPEGTVPVPAAVWLFGSGLIGLVGLARRKSYV